MKLSRSWLWLLLLIPLGLGLGRLRLDVEILNLLPEKLAVAQGLKIYQENFSDARELIITVEAPSAEEAEAAARSLAQRLRTESALVADVTWQPAWMESAAQATELVAFLWLNQAPSIFGELTNRLASANLTNVLAETREELATSFSPNDLARRGYDPYGLTRLPESVSGVAPGLGTGEELFVSRDGRFRLMFVEATPDLTSYRACKAWLAALQRIIDAAQHDGQLPAGAHFHFTGRPAFVTEIAGGMENDLTGSAGGTLATIGVLFWLTHRRLRPLFWLLLLLVGILAGTTALGGLFLGRINVVSMGFAAILLGLAEDFGIVIYQESRSHPELDARELRREVAPGIIWSAITTAGAFLILNLSVLPGLGQLGSLVAIGIVLAAVVMIYGYLPLVLRWRRRRDTNTEREAVKEKFLLFTSQRLLPGPVIWLISGLLLAGSIGVLWQQGLRFDHSPDVLKPRNSAASAVLDEMKARFGQNHEPLWLLVPGSDESQVARRLVEVETWLSRAVSNQLISAFTLPTALWPQPENQQMNSAAVQVLLQSRQVIEDVAIRNGFTTNALLITRHIFEHWERASSSTNVFWPTNHASHWILGKVVAHPAHSFLALGLIYPTLNNSVTKRLVSEWPKQWEHEGIILSGWQLLGSTVFEMVATEFPRVLIPIFILVVASLWSAFRNFTEVALSLSTLAFSAVCLGAMMNVLGWDWNILNLMALPLLLGMGVDFSIHIQLALRRYHGELMAVRHSVGRALLLAGSTTVVGFGSLAFSTNSGMASLGKVCALGIALALLTAVYLLPVWWKWAGSSTSAGIRKKTSRTQFRRNVQE